MHIKAFLDEESSDDDGLEDVKYNKDDLLKSDDEDEDEKEEEKLENKNIP